MSRRCEFATVTCAPRVEAAGFRLNVTVLAGQVYTEGMSGPARSTIWKRKRARAAYDAAGARFHDGFPSMLQITWVVIERVPTFVYQNCASHEIVGARPVRPARILSQEQYMFAKSMTCECFEEPVFGYRRPTAGARAYFVAVMLVCVRVRGWR